MTLRVVSFVQKRFFEYLVLFIVIPNIYPLLRRAGPESVKVGGLAFEKLHPTSCSFRNLGFRQGFRSVHKSAQHSQNNAFSAQIFRIKFGTNYYAVRHVSVSSRLQLRVASYHQCTQTHWTDNRPRGSCVYILSPSGPSRIGVSPSMT